MSDTLSLGTPITLCLPAGPWKEKGKDGLVFSASPERKKYTSSSFLLNQENGFSQKLGCRGSNLGQHRFSFKRDRIYTLHISRDSTRSVERH